MPLSFLSFRMATCWWAFQAARAPLTMARTSSRVLLAGGGRQGATVWAAVAVFVAMAYTFCSVASDFFVVQHADRVSDVAITAENDADPPVAARILGEVACQTLAKKETVSFIGWGH